LVCHIMVENEFQKRQYIHAIVGRILSFFGGRLASKTEFRLVEPSYCECRVIGENSTGALDIAVCDGVVLFLHFESKFKDPIDGVAQVCETLNIHRFCFKWRRSPGIIERRTWSFRTLTLC